MRTLIRRALSASGYQVDVAATLAEAREMGLDSYDAVLVDANLGSERGMDLVEAMVSEDPSAAARCVVITGGVADNIPEGVLCLAKPFRVGDLLKAVRTVHEADASRPRNRQAGLGMLQAARLQPPVPAGTPLHAGESRTWNLLGRARRLRARERGELVDFLHDGPIQELTAAALELEMMRRTASPSMTRHVDAVQKRLDAAAGSLRWLVDGQWPFVRPETQLATALQQRTAWLLAAPATVDMDEGGTAPHAVEIPLIGDIVEMILLEVASGSPARAHVMVQTAGQGIQVELTLTAAEDDRAIGGDQAAAQASLDELAAALGAIAHAELCDDKWRIQITLHRQPSPPLNGEQP
jgi:DNA-binding response OmpR family regulator